MITKPRSFGAATLFAALALAVGGASAVADASSAPQTPPTDIDTEPGEAVTGEVASELLPGLEELNSVDLVGAPAAAIDTGVEYHLETLALADEQKCLNGNVLGESSTLGGAAFMDDCWNAHGLADWDTIVKPGLSWQIAPSGSDGYYHLRTSALGADMCLEGNRHADDAFLLGGAFMDACSDVSGQLWKFVESEAAGHYRLQTAFLEGENKCFEGNRLAEDSVLGGAAFMDNCLNVTGQLWRLVPVSAEESVPAGVTQSVTLTIEQVDDAVTVLVGGVPVFTQGIVRHNQPDVVVDLAPHLSPGSNEVSVVARNNTSWGVFIATLAVDGQEVQSWRYADQFAPHHTDIVAETLTLEL